MGDFSFNEFQIPWYVPGTYVEYSNRRNNASVAMLPQKIIVFGQKLATGTATAGVPVLALGDDQAGQLAGRGSMLHHLARTVLAAVRNVPIWLYPLNDADGASASTRTLTFSGTATSAGSVALYVGGRRYGINVAASNTAAAVAAAAVAAIQADTLRFVDAAAVGAVVTLTARNAGVDAGKISAIVNRYSDETLPDGISLAIAALTAGAGNPTMAAAITALQNIWYPTMVMPYLDGANVSAMTAELVRRNGPVPQIEAVAFGAADDTVQNLLGLADSRNSPFWCLGDASDYLTPAYMWAASAAGLQAALAQSNPALPEQTQPMPMLVAKSADQRRSIPERQALLAGGISTAITGDDGMVYAERFVTTYRTNAYGVADKSRFDVCHTRLWAQTRFGLRLWFSSRFPNWKLGQDGSLGAQVMTPKLAKSEMTVFYKSYMQLGIYEGGAAYEKFKTEVDAKVDETDPNQLDCYFPPDFMNQLRTTAILVEPVG